MKTKFSLCILSFLLIALCFTEAKPVNKHGPEKISYSQALVISHELFTLANPDVVLLKTGVTLTSTDPRTLDALGADEINVYKKCTGYVDLVFRIVQAPNARSVCRPVAHSPPRQK